MRRLVTGLVFAVAATCQAYTVSAAAPCRDGQLDRHGSPTALQDFDAAGNQRFNPLFDAGAWHGFLLPGDTADDGGFTGRWW